MQTNQQKPLRIHRDPTGELRVHTMFKTIQGEGPYAGHAALFIRLTGCNLQCPGCDTEYTSKSQPMTPETLVQIVEMFYGWNNGDLIVLTGGEPFRQNITPLVDKLLAHGYEVQIETNGVLYPGDDFPWKHPGLTVVCSPKTGKIHPTTAGRVHAFKYVLSHDSIAPDGLPITALGHPLGSAKHVARPPARWDGPIYVNPMDAQDKGENDANLQAVVDTVMEHPQYIMGVQMHKLTGLP